MYRTRGILLASVALLAALGARADAALTVRYVNPQGLPAMIAEVNDRGDTRISQGNQYAVLTVGGVTYLLLSDLSGTFAIRQEDWFAVNLAAVNKAMPAADKDAGKDLPPYEIVRGGNEVVAGRTGTLWTVRQKGAPDTAGFDLVICEDADLAPIGVAFERQMAASTAGMAEVMGSAGGLGTKMAEVMKKGAMIRMSRVLRLESVKAGPVPDADFVLPPTVLTREQYAARIAGR